MVPPVLLTRALSDEPQVLLEQERVGVVVTCCLRCYSIDNLAVYAGGMFKRSPVECGSMA